MSSVQFSLSFRVSSMHYVIFNLQNIQRVEFLCLKIKIAKRHFYYFFKRQKKKTNCWKKNMLKHNSLEFICNWISIFLSVEKNSWKKDENRWLGNWDFLRSQRLKLQFQGVFMDAVGAFSWIGRLQLWYPKICFILLIKMEMP